MATLSAFRGINNVSPSSRKGDGELDCAGNVFIDLTGALRPRSGTVLKTEGVAQSVWAENGRFGVLGGDLVSIADDGTPTMLRADVGTGEAHWLAAPDGSTLFMNDAVFLRIASGAACDLGVPVPASIGIGLDSGTGSLLPGQYRWGLSYVRTADKLEGGAIFSEPVTITAGRIALSGLPRLAGHTLNVYLTGADGDAFFYAGNTAGTGFNFSGANESLIIPCRTGFMQPPPLGQCLGQFRGRLLVGEGSILWASRVGQIGLFDVRRDYLQFSSTVRFALPVDDGLYVGTGDEVVFLRGLEFGKLVRQRVDDGVLPGSAVAVNGNLIGLGGGNMGSGSAVMCIAGGAICAGFSGGNWIRLTEGKYRVPEAVTKVSATFRRENGMPQYLAAVLP